VQFAHKIIFRKYDIYILARKYRLCNKQS